eukprot:3815109-Prymnesium_polylepis.1
MDKGVAELSVTGRRLTSAAAGPAETALAGSATQRAALAGALVVANDGAYSSRCRKLGDRGRRVGFA